MFHSSDLNLFTVGIILLFLPRYNLDGILI
jgi:hypothetical protein